MKDKKRKNSIEKKLERLMPIFAHAAMGDFDQEIEIPEKEDEFTQLYSGINIMLEVIHQKIAELEEEIRIRKKVELDLRRKQVELQRIIKREKRREKRKDEFIALASHELKTPITSLKIFTKGLERLLAKKGQTEVMPQLASMDKQLNRLSHLVNDLLDASRVKQGKLEYTMETFSLDMLIEEIINNIKRITSTHKIVFTHKAGKTVLGDRHKVEQVLINLITNAIKYSPEGDKVIIKSLQTGKKVLVSVQDFGIGIPGGQHKEIFERFYQVDSTVGKTYPGLGLGLYISSKIIERHHGKIWLESEEGKGSTFYFSLPVT